MNFKLLLLFVLVVLFFALIVIFDKKNNLYSQYNILKKSITKCNNDVDQTTLILNTLNQNIDRSKQELESQKAVNAEVYLNINSKYNSIIDTFNNNQIVKIEKCRVDDGFLDCIPESMNRVKDGVNERIWQIQQNISTAKANLEVCQNNLTNLKEQELLLNGQFTDLQAKLRSEEGFKRLLDQKQQFIEDFDKELIDLYRREDELLHELTSIRD